jgi:hypothetical protein
MLVFSRRRGFATRAATTPITANYYHRRQSPQAPPTTESVRDPLCVTVL